MSLGTIQYARKPKTITLVEITEENIQEFVATHGGRITISHYGENHTPNFEAEVPSRWKRGSSDGDRRGSTYVAVGNFVELTEDGKVDSVWRSLEDLERNYDRLENHYVHSDYSK